MSDRLKSFDFKGHKIDTSLFVGSESFKLLHVLQQKIFPSIAAIFGAIDLSNGFDLKKTNIDLSVLKEGIKTLYDGLGSDDAAFALIRRILKETTVYAKSEDGKIYRMSSESDFDEFFAGRIEWIYMLVFEVLKLNYPFFLGKVPSLSELTKKISIISKSATHTDNVSKSAETSDSSPMKSGVNGHASGFSVADILEQKSSQ